MTVLAMHL